MPLVWDEEPQQPPTTQPARRTGLVWDEEPGRPEPTVGQRVGGMAAAVGVPLLAAVAGPAGWAGLGLTAAATFTGELARQRIEGEEQNLGLAAVETPLGMIPGGKIAKGASLGRIMGQRAVEGGAMAALGSVPRQMARGEDVSLGRIAEDAIIGTGIGGGFGAGEKAVREIAPVAGTLAQKLLTRITGETPEPPAPRPQGPLPFEAPPSDAMVPPSEVSLPPSEPLPWENLPESSRPTLVTSRRNITAGGNEADPALPEFAKYLPAARPVKLKDGTTARMVLGADPQGDGGKIIAFGENGEFLGGLDFSFREESPGVRINPSVEVVESKRRMGLGTALYDYAEEAGGLIPAVDQPGQVRSPDAVAFRAAREAARRGQPIDVDGGIQGPPAPEAPTAAAPPVEPPPVPPAPAQPAGQAPAPAAPAPVEPSGIPVELARRIQGLADDAPNVPEVTAEDVARYERIQSRPAGAEFEVPLTRNPNERVRLRWRIVSLDDLLPNDPRVQPRDRGDRMASENQVALIAADPRADEWMRGNDLMTAGTPIIGPDGLPEGGNGRTMGLLRARSENPEKWAQFQADQRAKAGQAGFRPEDLDAVPDPVLIRERVSLVADRLDFADQTNADRRIAMSAAEKAVRDSQRLPEGVIEALRVGDSQTFDAALTSGTNRNAVRGFLATLQPEEAAGLVDKNGQLSADGVRRMKAAVLGKVFPGENGKRLVRSITESTDSGVKQAEAGIGGALPALVKVRQTVAEYPETDITEDLAWAVKKLAQLRSEKTSVDDYLRQGGMFDPERSQQRDLLVGFVGEARSAKQIREALQGYAARLAQLPPKSQGSLLAPPPVPVQTFLAESIVDAVAGRQRQIGDILVGEEGGIETPQFIVKLLRRMASYAPEVPPNRPVREVPFRETLRKSRKKSLGQMLGKNPEAGTSPPPPPAVELLDPITGKPLPRTGNLRAPQMDEPSELRNYLANSSLEEGYDLDHVFQIKNKIAQSMAPEVDYARRGVRSNKETEAAARPILVALADRLGKDPDAFADNIRARGEGNNAEQLLALSKVTDDLRDLFVKAATTAKRTGSVEDRETAWKTLQVFKGLVLQEAGAKAEAGRALQILQAAKRSRSTEALEKALASVGGDEGKLNDIFDLVLSADGPDQVTRLMTAAATETKFDKILKLWLSGLLSGPATHAANIAGNASMQALRTLQRPVAAGLDAITARASGRARERFVGEMLADAMGMAAPVRAAAQAGKQAFDEASVVGMAEGMKAAARATLRQLRVNPLKGASKFDDPAITQASGRAMRIATTPLRALAAADDVFKSLGYYGDLYARAYRAAKQAGDANPVQGMYERLASPDADMVDAAKLEAAYRTFTAPDGPWVRKINALRQQPLGRSGIKPLSVIIPFLRSPAQLAMAGAKHSPMGAVALLYQRAGGELKGGELADESAKVVIGSLLSGAVVMAALEGKVTGSPPSDAEQRRAWEQAGNQAYSFKVGDQWVSYERFDPLALVIGATVDTVNATRAVEWADAAAQMALAYSNNLLNKTFMRGLSDGLEAVMQPERYGGAWLESMFASLVPAGVGAVARAIDPTVRRPETVLQAMQNRIPGMRDRVPIVRDVFGEPIKMEGSAAERLFSPVRRRNESHDPATREIARLGVAPGSPSKSLGIGVRGLKGTIDLTPEEYEAFVIESGRESKRRVERIIAQPAYRSMSEQQQVNELEAAFRSARADTREKMLPAIRSRAIGDGSLNRQTVQRAGSYFFSPRR